MLCFHRCVCDDDCCDDGDDDVSLEKSGGGRLDVDLLYDDQFLSCRAYSKVSSIVLSWQPDRVEMNAQCLQATLGESVRSRRPPFEQPEMA